MRIRLAACVAVAVAFTPWTIPSRAANIDGGTVIAGCQYNASGITLPNSGYANLQCNSAGQLLTTGGGGGGGGGGPVYPAPGSSPFPVSAATTLPVSIATTVPVSIATTVPVSFPGVISAQLVPASMTQAAIGQYNPSPAPLAAGQVAPANLDPLGNLQVTVVNAASPPPASLSALAGTISSANTSQPIAIPNTARTSFTVCEPYSNVFPLWIRDDGQPATEDMNSIQIEPGQCYSPDGRVSVGELDLISTGTPTFFAREVQ